MIEKKLEGLLSSYSVKCRGTDCDSKKVLPKGDAEQVIVKVYRNGASEPLCRYLSGSNSDKCKATNTEDETQIGFCVYKTFG